VEFHFSEHRNLPAAKRFFEQALERHGRQTNREAIVCCKAAHRSSDKPHMPSRPITIRKSKYLNNRIEQNHRRIKRRIRPMLGFKSLESAATILSGIELVHIMRKRQARFSHNPNPSLAEQFAMLAA
jgi:putative transposase